MGVDPVAGADVQPGAAGLGAAGFGQRELVVMGRATRVEAAEGVDPSAADRGEGAGGLLVHPAIMARGVRRRSAELERKSR
jgi:hypothetical protein